MKKIFTLIVLFAITIAPIYSQSILQDAIFLRKHVNSVNQFECKSRAAFIPVFKKYMAAPGLNSYSGLRLNTKPGGAYNNPYIFSLLSDTCDEEVGLERLNPATNIFSNLGGLDVTNIADGLSRFLVKRAKQELSITFFTRFKKEMDDTAYADLRILFPTTYKTLKAIDTEIYQYSAYINTLRESFKKDLNALPTNVYAVLQQQKYQRYFKKHPEIKYLIDNAFVISNGLLNNTHPGDILHKIATQKYDESNDTLKNFSSSVKVVDLFSQSFRDTSKTRYWLPVDTINLLRRDPILCRIYFGLVTEKSRSEKIVFVHNNVNIDFTKEILIKAGDHIDSVNKFIDFTENLIIKGEAIDTKIKVIKAKKAAGEMIEYEDYYYVVDNTLNLFDYAAQVEELPYLKTKLADKKVFEYTRSFVYLGKLVNETALDVSLKNYNSAIINTSMLIDTVFSYMQNKDKGIAVSRKVLKYGTFAVSLATAESAEQAEQIIENMALPAGSARIKKHMAFSVSLNSYLGGFYGTNDGYKSRNGLSYGVTGLIGVGLNWGICKKHPMSISAFGSVLDIGALAAFRLNDNTEDYKFKIKLSQILSPGGFVVLGLPSMPISVLAGYQYAPLIRTIQNSETMLLYDPSYNRGRFTVGIVVDIPLMHFYNKTKKYN